MNCQECQNLVQQRLDGGDVPDTAELEGHLAECGECRQLTGAARRLEEGLRLLPAPLPPAGWANRVVGQVLAQRRRRFQWRFAVTVSGLAAAVLVAVGAVQFWPAPHENARPTPELVEQPKPPEPVRPPSLNDSVAEVGSAVAALARRTTEETVDQTRVLWLEPGPVALGGRTKRPLRDRARYNFGPPRRGPVLARVAAHANRPGHQLSV
jgi:hypothetical protein